MSKKGSRPTDGGGNWMDTYGDMVTLLMTFFVMLYSMSSISQQKWEVFVRSIHPEDIEEQIDVGGELDPTAQLEGAPPSELTTTETPDLDTLYLLIAASLNNNGVEGATVSRGNGYTFVSFDNNIFFNGDESALTESGKVVLEAFCTAIDPVSEQLGEINVMAHTAQGDPTRLNTPRVDRMLSAMRGSEVCIFIQERDVIEPEKLINISYGQFRPVASNDTSEGRAKNRRVEMLLIDEGVEAQSISEYLDEYNSGANAETTIVTDGKPVEVTPAFSETEPMPENMASTMAPLESLQEDPADGEASQ